MKLNISFPATGFQKFIKVDNEHKLGTFYENCMTTKVAVGILGEELKNYIVRMVRFSHWARCLNPLQSVSAVE